MNFSEACDFLIFIIILNSSFDIFGLISGQYYSEPCNLYIHGVGVVANVLLAHSLMSSFELDIFVSCSTIER